jgi:hypothetical protein
MGAKAASSSPGAGSPQEVMPRESGAADTKTSTARKPAPSKLGSLLGRRRYATPSTFYPVEIFALVRLVLFPSPLELLTSAGS